MARYALFAHALVLMASLAGVVGMGLVFQGVMHGDLVQLSRGVALLLVGLWWSGRQLGRSMLARRRLPTRPGLTGDRVR
ncbi:MAG: hypothetical protein M3Z66_11350 [Chloroflexota bacterium]|nr:hypothetical protein [Chloroflexota bacterium]